MSQNSRMLQHRKRTKPFKMGLLFDLEIYFKYFPKDIFRTAING